jgi:glycosyltransferase involved in cell wall biosynthesis
VTQSQSEKLVFYVPSLAGGGAERTMLNLACGFADRGMKVDLVLAKAEGPYLADVPSSVRLIDLNSSRVLASLPHLVSYLRREKPDAMVSTLHHANIVAIWAKCLARVSPRLIISEQNVYREVELRRAWWLAPLMHYFYPWADGIVAVSTGVADNLSRTARLPRDRVAVIYNPAVTPELLDKARQPLPHPWFAANQPPVVLAVGRLTKQKDYPTLLRAFALTRDRCAARLLILGEGEARAELEQQIRTMGLHEHVALPGFVDNPYAYMARAAVLVLSSAWEGLPTVLIEAMACGCPVVSTDCPSGPAEILEGGRFGQLVAVGDASAMAAAILRTIGEVGSRTTSNSQGRARDFTLERAIKAYGDILFRSEDLPPRDSIRWRMRSIS